MDVYWLEQTSADVPAGEDWLAAEECVRLSRLRVLKRRADWCLGRWTAKCAVSALLATPGLRLADVSVRPAASGAPEIFVRGQPAPLTISLTHSSGVAVCAISRSGALGCDLELVEPRSRAFVADYFTAEEREFIGHAVEADRVRLINLLWSAKESALKALRVGLRRDTRDLLVTAVDDGTRNDWRPIDVRCASGENFRGWWRERGNLVCTVVASPPPSQPIPLRQAYVGYGTL